MAIVSPNPSAVKSGPATIPIRPTPPAAFPFTMLPDVIASDRELSPGAKLLFGVIFTSARRGHCYMSNETLAARCGLSMIQVRRLLAILEGKGMISRDLNGKSRDEIRVPMACIKKIQAADQNDASPCINLMQDHASKRCTELESRVENLEDSFSLPPEEDPDVPSGPITETAAQILARLKAVGELYRVPRGGGAR